MKTPALLSWTTVTPPGVEPDGGGHMTDADAVGEADLRLMGDVHDVALDAVPPVDGGRP